MVDFDLGVIIRSAGYLFYEGMAFTLFLTFFAGTLGFALGILLAVLRSSSYRPVRWLAATYVNTIRSLPLVLVIFWFFFLVPFVTQWVVGSPRPVAVGAVWSALITFTLFEAAYFCEIIRSGINGIPRGQIEASSALGFRPAQRFLLIILPQAVRTMTPVILTQFIILFQDTSLVYVVSLTDFLGAAGKIGQRDGRLVEMYLFSAAVYFVICYAASILVRRLSERNTISLARAGS